MPGSIAEAVGRTQGPRCGQMPGGHGGHPGDGGDPLDRVRREPGGGQPQVAADHEGGRDVAGAGQTNPDRGGESAQRDGQHQDDEGQRGGGRGPPGPGQAEERDTAAATRGQAAEQPHRQREAAQHQQTDRRRRPAGEPRRGTGRTPACAMPRRWHDHGAGDRQHADGDLERAAQRCRSGADHLTARRGGRDVAVREDGRQRHGEHHEQRREGRHPGVARPHRPARYGIAGQPAEHHRRQHADSGLGAQAQRPDDPGTRPGPA